MCELFFFTQHKKEEYDDTDNNVWIFERDEDHQEG